MWPQHPIVSGLSKAPEGCLNCVGVQVPLPGLAHCQWFEQARRETGRPRGIPINQETWGKRGQGFLANDSWERGLEYRLGSSDALLCVRRQGNSSKGNTSRTEQGMRACWQYAARVPLPQRFSQVPHQSSFPANPSAPSVLPLTLGGPLTNLTCREGQKCDRESLGQPSVVRDVCPVLLAAGVGLW